MKLVDLTGDRYGRLVVLSRAENKVYKSGRSTPQWLCQCDCGKRKAITGINLRGQRPTRSCGCARNESKLIDLAGQRFNRLVAIERVAGKKTKWLCRCDCGEPTVVESYNLRTGASKSCGCYAREVKRENGLLMGRPTF